MNTFNVYWEIKSSITDMLHYILNCWLYSKKSSSSYKNMLPYTIIRKKSKRIDKIKDLILQNQ